MKIQNLQITGLFIFKTWKLILAGDGIRRKEIEKFFGSETRFVGELKEDQLFKYYCASDIFVWPAIQEAYGMALLEAQWLGLPAVVGNNGGVSDILNDQVTGFLAAPGYLPDFTAKLTTLIEDIGCREQMRAAATQITRSEHSFEMAAKKMDLLIKNSLNNYRIRT